MADAIGNVYFDALLQTQKLESQIRELERKRYKAYFDAVFQTNDLTKKAQAAAAEASRNATVRLQTKLELDRQQVQQQVNEATRNAQANIGAKIRVNDQAFKKQIGALGVAGGNILANAFDKSTEAITAAFSTAAGFASNSVKSYTEIAGILTQVQAKAGATDEAMAGLRQTIVQTAGQTAANVVQMTKLSEVMVQAGRSITDINAALPGLARGSAATGRAADKLAGDLILYLDSYQLNADQTESVLNRLVGTTLAANVNANQLAQSMKFFRSASEGLKGVENQLKVTALAASAGLSGGQAGRNSAALFAAAIKKADEVAKEFNVSVKDSSGNLRSEVDVLLELRAEFNRIAESQGSAVAAAQANSLFGVQGSRILTGVAKLSEETITGVLSKIDEASKASSSVLNDLASAAQRGLAGSALAIQNSIGTIQFQLGEALSKSIAAIGFGLSGIFQEIAKNTEAFTALSSAGERFNAALSAPEAVASLNAIASLVSEVVGQALVDVAGVLDSITMQIQTNPQIIEEIGQKIIAVGQFVIEVGRIVGASIAAIGSVVFSFFEGLSQGLGTAKQDTSGILDLIRLAGELIAGLARPIGYVTGLVAGLALQLTSVFSSLGGGISFGVDTGDSNPFTGIVNAFNNLQNMITEVIANTELFARLGQQLKTVLDGVVAGIQSFVANFLTNAAPGIQQLIEGVQAALPGISALVERIVGWIVSATPVFQSLMGFLGTSLGNAVSLAGTLLGNLITIVGTVSQIIANSGALDLVFRGLQGTVKFILDTLTLTYNAITSIQGFLYNAILPAINAIIAVIGTASNIITAGWLAPFQAVYDLIFQTNTLADNFIIQTLNKFAPQIEQIKTIATTQWNDFAGLVTNWFTSTLPKAVAGAWASLTEGFDTVKTNISNFFVENFLGFFTTRLPEATASFYSAEMSKFDGVKDLVVGWITDTLIPFFTTVIPERVNSFISTLTTRITETGEFIRNWFQDSIISFITTRIPEVYSNLITTILTRVEEVRTRVSEWFASIILWVNQTVANAVSSFVSFLFEQVQNIQEILNQFFDFIRQTVTETIPNQVQQLGEYVSDHIQDVWDFFLSNYEKLRAIITEAIPNLVRQLQEFVQEQLNKIWERIQQLYEAIRTFLLETLPGYVNYIKDKIFEFVGKTVGRVQEFFKQIQTFVTETIPGYVNTLFTNITGQITSLGTTIVDTVKKPIDDIGSVFSNIVNSSKSIAENISGWGKSVQNFIGEFGSNTWNSLLNVFGGGGAPQQGNASDLLAFLGGDLTAQEFLSRNSLFGSSGGINDAAARRLAESYWGSPDRGSNENIFEQAGLSQAVVDLVKLAENFIPQAYYDPNLPDIYNLTPKSGLGSYSSGFGTYARSASEVLSIEEANRRLRDELLKAQNETIRITRELGYNFNENQIAALTSLSYNAGSGILRQLTDNGNRSVSQISEALLRYNKSGSRTLLGLTRRREVEKLLFDAAPVVSNTIIQQVGNGLYDSYLTGLIPGQKYGASRSGGARRHAGTDFDIQDRGGTFESFIGGRVINSGYDPGGYYRYFDIRNDALGVVERIAELDEFFIKVGDLVQPGQLVGRSSTDTGVVHVEYRPIPGYESNPFGFSGTIDPIRYLTQTLGLFTLNGTKFTPVGGTATTRAGDGNQFGGISDNLLRASQTAQQILEGTSYTSVQLQSLTDAIAAATATSLLAPATSAGTTTGTSVYGLLLEGVNKAVALLESANQSLLNFSGYINLISDYLYSVRQRVLGKVNVGLASADSENFRLINQGRLQLQEQRFLGDRLPRLFTLQEERAAAGGAVTGGINQQSQSSRQYSFTDNIARIASYAQMLYEMIGQRLGLVSTDTGTSSEFTSAGLTTTPITDALNRISNQLNQWYESLMLVFNRITGNTDTNTAIATAAADAPTISAALSSLTTVLTDFYRILEEKQAKLADYYQMEGVDIGSVPDKMQLIQEMITSALSDRLSAINFDNESVTALFANIGTTIADRIGDRIALTGTDGSQLGLDISRGDTAPKRFQFETTNGLPLTAVGDDQFVTVKQLRELEDYVNSPQFTSDIAIGTVESLRRDPGMRSVILG